MRLRGLGKNTAGIGATIRLTAGGATQTRMMMTTRGYMSAQDPVEHFNHQTLGPVSARPRGETGRRRSRRP